MCAIKQLLKDLFKISEVDEIKKQVLNENIDFKNVVSSSLLAKGVYDELKKVCHPDKFQNEHDIIKANKLFQLVTQNKSDYNKLLQIKEQVYKELPILSHKHDA